ncbi:chemotaxis protein CheW [Betaproteobacteria bacterium GR16-43]|nr:chemotaxis protein CheW [Betaproteobacteria bacterium GR16-43]
METSVEYLAYSLGAEEYAIDILKVREIRAYETPTRIAGAPASMKGVINLRGTIIPIVDMRIRNGAAQVAYDESTVVIILELSARMIGIVVDGVSDVLHIDAANLRPVPEMNSFDARHMTGLATHEGRMLIVVDVEALFALDGHTAKAA